MHLTRSHTQHQGPLAHLDAGVLDQWLDAARQLRGVENAAVGELERGDVARRSDFGLEFLALQQRGVQPHRLVALKLALELGGLLLVDGGFEHAVFLEVAGHAVFRHQPLDMSDAVEARVEGLAAELRTHLVHPRHQSGEAGVAEAPVAAAGAVSAAGAFEQHDVLVGKSAA